MGHAVGKDVYRKLGKSIDSLSLRAPWNETCHAILKELYSENEADVAIKMPYSLSNFERIEKTTKYEGTELHKILEGLCSKGLVVDLWIDDEYKYMLSPMIIGIFEFTMMRTGDDLNTKEWARLFHRYLEEDDSFFAANFKSGEQVSIMRTLPHEDAIMSSEYVEVLDYEKATAIVEGTDKFSIGLCSCRHEKLHVEQKECDVPLDTCSTFGIFADYLIRRDLAKEASKTEMLENLARSKELGLVLSADNVKKNVNFICHCCGCCCNVLLGINKFGYTNPMVTSSFIANIDEDTCTGCGKCVKACQINAIEMISLENPEKKKKQPKIDKDFCLGCGVCAFKCETGSLKLVKREQRVLHPESTFERIILQNLERGTLQNQLFDNPQSITQEFMRCFVGGFLRLTPVKKALMSDMLRSVFLRSMKKGIELQGKGWVMEM